MVYRNSKKSKGTGMRRLTSDEHELGMVEVDDVGIFPIVSDLATLSPIQDPRKQPVYWNSIRTLNIGVGIEVYGCADCDYVAKSPGQVRPHRNAHAKAKVTTTNGELSKTVADLRDVLRAVDQVAQLTAERDEWKRRALAAERDLAAIRKRVAL